MLAVLRNIEAILGSDEYETSDPYTIGGASGGYLVQSPYNTECEWVLISGTYLGTMASQGSFTIMSKNPQPPTLSTTGANAFGAAGNKDSNALQAYVGSLTSQASFITYDSSNWMPLPAPAFVYAQVTSAANSEVLVTVQFRRKLNRYMPAKPRQKAHTHSHVQSRRGYRTMMAGFNSQYPEEGVPYRHEVIPVSQDTAMGKRGVFPLGPTTVTHRGVARGQKK